MPAARVRGLLLVAKSASRGEATASGDAGVPGEVAGFGGYPLRVTRPPPDPARGAEVARDSEPGASRASSSRLRSVATSQRRSAGCPSAPVPKSWVVPGTLNRSPNTATGIRPTSISHAQSEMGAKEPLRTQSSRTGFATGSTFRKPLSGHTREISRESGRLARRPPRANASRTPSPHLSLRTGSRIARERSPLQVRRGATSP